MPVGQSKRPALGVDPPRLEWLDGVRGAAALFVVIHHVWLAAFAAGTFPVAHGPAALTALGYGHLAVAVFIVVSGFSLGLAPARHGRRLDGAGAFARRRAWRILPPYWAALALSVAVVTFVLGPGEVSGQTWRTLLVHGLLLQDVVASEVPNGTFWSIAVESQIYVLFPLLVWAWRRWGASGVTVAATLAVLAAHAVARSVPPLQGLDNLTPQFLALFVFGLVASGPVASGPVAHEWHRAISAGTLRGLAGAGLAAVAAGMGLAGLTRSVAAYFWIDLVVGALVATGFVGLCARPRSLVRGLLSTGPAVRLGAFSYSSYLTHAPVLAVLWEFVVAPRGLAPVPAFAVLLVVGLPLSYAVAYLFYRLVERPFLTIRSFAALRRAIRGALQAALSAAAPGRVTPTRSSRAVSR